ncbi:shikimate kinase [Halalkalibacter okhensis]|uniref:Shikimate kinase n=2 Tax=Halalkalibacter okhensis TaxID=333138 RepID=A0A0B0IEH6_9BACI|nr:shikimate kinase [Halalkalibacter okhensis]
MGSGKTTIGQALADKIGYHVIDTDKWVENKEQMSISEIFEKKGEDYFRDLETQALLELQGDHMIITTGGGIIKKDRNREIMASQGEIIYLQADFDELLRRLEGDETRPLLQQQDKERIQALYESRLELYEQADIIVNTVGRSVLGIVAELESILKS